MIRNSKILVGLAGPNCRFEKMIGAPVYLSYSLLVKLMDCTPPLCDGSCCNHGGAWVATEERDRYIEDRPKFEKYLDEKRNIPINLLQPFHNTTDDNYEEHIYHTGQNCAFLVTKGDGQKLCGIHTYAIEEGLDWRQYKPRGCIIFPATIKWGHKKSYLVASYRRWKGVRCSTPDENGMRLIDIQKKSLCHIFDISEDVYMAIRDKMVLEAEKNGWVNSDYYLQK